ncbi:polar amino acid transport system permease protein [Bradyrhizobium sp. F1.4.3]|uniref:amino acid ABC transporter permease n=1 Tax=Bradyrhizobium sp. F1.4.3 TaxID=3156356 RepID=UPI0033997D99
MGGFADAFLNTAVLVRIWPLLRSGFGTTVVLSVIVVPAGLMVGLCVALLQTVPYRPLRWGMVVYTDLFRAFPPLVLLIYVYYGLPFFGINTNALWSVVMALTLNTSAYFGEVFRAGIESIPRGQIQAARATGLTAGQTIAYVVLPQAIRNLLPDLTSNVLETIKLTSLASVVTLPELLRAARLAQGNTTNATPLIAAAAIYLVCLWPLVRLTSRFERQLLAART